MHHPNWAIEARLAERGQRHLVRWLDSIADDEWQGTPTDAWDALIALASHGVHQPLNPGPMLEKSELFIRSKGWMFTIGRTGRGRYIRLTRSDKQSLAKSRMFPRPFAAATHVKFPPDNTHSTKWAILSSLGGDKYRRLDDLA
jgi:hypothetical protein